MLRGLFNNLIKVLILQNKKTQALILIGGLSLLLCNKIKVKCYILQKIVYFWSIYALSIRQLFAWFYLADK